MKSHKPVSIEKASLKKLKMILSRIFPFLIVIIISVNARQTSQVIELNESNWELMLEDGSEWMVEL